MSIAERLRTEVANKYSSVLKFQQDMAGVRGSSYSSVVAYLNPASGLEPSVEFLTAAAKLFGVRPEYLILGSGARTNEEERAARRGAGTEPTGIGWWGQFCQSWDRLPEFHQGMLTSTLSRWQSALEAGTLSPDPEAPPSDKAVGEAFDRVFKLLAIDQARVPASNLEAFTVQFASALMAVIPRAAPVEKGPAE